MLIVSAFVRLKATILLGCVATVIAMGQTRTIALDPAGMKLANVKAEKTVWKGRDAIRITAGGPENLRDGMRLAMLTETETDFQDGSIEVDLAGDTLPGMPPVYRGFTGIAFRAAPDSSKYECFYLRTKNGRSEDQEQRNHSAQYISFPDFPWEKLRKETPGKYESYVDLVPGEWTKVKIDVRNEKARLYVHGAGEPVLIVNDLKLGHSKGAIALWVGPGAVGHFSNLRVTR